MSSDFDNSSRASRSGSAQLHQGRATHIFVATICLITLIAGPAQAQHRLFPDAPSFELPLADPRVTSLTGRLLSVSRGDSRFGAGHEAEAAIGESVPVIALRRGPRWITLGFGAAVYGRFDLDDPKSAQISDDWTVGVDLSAVLRAWTLSLQVEHESSHLGDEYHDTFGVPRLDWTRETATAWVGWHTGPLVLHGALSYVLVDQLGLRRAGAAAAADFRGNSGRLLGQAMRPIAGVFIRGEADTDWRLSADAKAGIALLGARADRELRLSLIAHRGLSTQRQFYRETSHYIGLEIQFEI
ncbi:MAG: DUF1207 domain-containing protein [Gemmatimonadota bacterium]